MIADNNTPPLRRILNLVKLERRNIRFLYAYAIISGALSLSIPLGIQALMGLVLGGRLSSGWFILVLLVVLAVIVAGISRLAQMSILENIQRKLFVRNAFEFASRLVHSRLARRFPSLVELAEKFLDVITVQKSFSKLVLDFTASVLQIAFGVLLLIIYHEAFILFAGILVLIVFVALRLSWQRGIESARAESDYKFKTAWWLTEIAQNKYTFRLKSDHGFHLSRTDDYLKGYVHSRSEHFKVLYSQARLAIFLKVFLTAALLIMGSILLVEQKISLGQFLASEILVITLLDAVEKLILTVENIYDCGIALEKLGFVTDEDAQEHTGLDISLKSAPDLCFRNPISGEIINLLKNGEDLGICGYRGTGRTAVLKTILGEHHPALSVQINQIPATNYNLEKLGNHVGLCLQNSGLYEGTLLQNITMGQETYMDHVTELLDALSLNEYVGSLNMGYNHRFELNASVPDNVQKKIPLARALYGSPPMVLIDDIWTSFDRVEMKKILTYLKKIDSTLVIVSNYLPVLQAMDQLMFVDQAGFRNPGSIDTALSQSDIQNIIWK
ncbi:MAG: ATP-binding cassette domain-containing protein [Bacteroidetes bacterium]|nr:ATP-binding cassette domain-containing protein [Bacteroidota bacterium]